MEYGSVMPNVVRATWKIKFSDIAKDPPNPVSSFV
jgi:hypothetical protein